MAICGPFQACTRSPLCTPGRATPTAWAPTGTQGRVPIAPTGTGERVLIAPTGTQTRTGTRYRSLWPLCPLWSSPKIGRTVFAGFSVLPSDRRDHSEPSWGFNSPLSHFTFLYFACTFRPPGLPGSRFGRSVTFGLCQNPLVASCGFGQNPTGRVGIGCLGDQRLVLEGRHELDGMSPIFSCAKRHIATVKDRKSQY